MTKKELEKRNYMLLKCISFYIHYFKARQEDRGGIIVMQRGRFRFIPADLDQVLYFLSKVVKYYNKKGISTHSLKFLDAGCGIGNVLTIANLMGFQAHGIEIDNKNIRIAKKLVTNSCEIHFKIIKGNILTFKNYSNYNVIYFYCPLYSQKKEKLCLYRPKYREWNPTQHLAKTIVPWLYLWLFYFEEWLVSNDWKGGGEHPPQKD